MEKLHKGLAEVDNKVENLKKKFERTTTEAAKLKVELEKAEETIVAAENLVGKLEGEYQRWSGQVRAFLYKEVMPKQYKMFCWQIPMQVATALHDLAND